jgi:hypothetical protein
MRKTIMGAGAAVAALLAMLLLTGCSQGGDKAFTFVGDEQRVSGRVVKTELTLCGPAPDQPGTCAGTLILVPDGGSEAESITLEVTRAVALKQGGQTVFLTQLEGSQVNATYLATQEGPKVATSVVAPH